MNISLSVNRDLDANDILQLYQANKWSAADKPELLIKAFLNSHSLVTVWDGATLVGLGNAISDGYLVVYYPHLLVLPSYQGKGVGRLIMDKMLLKTEMAYPSLSFLAGSSIKELQGLAY